MFGFDVILGKALALASIGDCEIAYFAVTHNKLYLDDNMLVENHQEFCSHVDRRLVIAQKNHLWTKNYVSLFALEYLPVLSVVAEVKRFPTTMCSTFSSFLVSLMFIEHKAARRYGRRTTVKTFVKEDSSMRFSGLIS